MWTSRCVSKLLAFNFVFMKEMKEKAAPRHTGRHVILEVTASCRKKGLSESYLNFRKICRELSENFARALCCVLYQEWFWEVHGTGSSWKLCVSSQLSYLPSYLRPAACCPKPHSFSVTFASVGILSAHPNKLLASSLPSNRRASTWAM